MQEDCCQINLTFYLSGKELKITIFLSFVVTLQYSKNIKFDIF